ncbi:MAG: hypothetical protein ABI761_00730 [Saprospiraceae bacterium]
METRRYSSGHTILGLIVMALFIYAAFILFKGIFRILAWASPFMFIAALIVNYKVVLSYGKLLINLLQKNMVTGIIAILLTFLAFPIVAALLLAFALMNRKAESFIAQEKQNREGIPTDFREISSDPKPYEDLLKRNS